MAHGSVFYCVAMPGSVARTSTMALTGAALPYVLELADLGWTEAPRRDTALTMGLNRHRGEMLCPHVAADLQMPLGTSPLGDWAHAGGSTNSRTDK